LSYALPSPRRPYPQCATCVVPPAQLATSRCSPPAGPVRPGATATPSARTSAPTSPAPPTHGPSGPHRPFILTRDVALRTGSQVYAPEWTASSMRSPGPGAAARGDRVAPQTGHAGCGSSPRGQPVLTVPRPVPAEPGRHEGVDQGTWAQGPTESAGVSETMRPLANELQSWGGPRRNSFISSRPCKPAQPDPPLPKLAQTRWLFPGSRSPRFAGTELVAGIGAIECVD
jgi:hypothetical protein